MKERKLNDSTTPETTVTKSRVIRIQYVIANHQNKHHQMLSLCNKTNNFSLFHNANETQRNEQ